MGEIALSLGQSACNKRPMKVVHISFNYGDPLGIRAEYPPKVATRAPFNNYFVGIAQAGATSTSQSSAAHKVLACGNNDHRNAFPFAPRFALSQARIGESKAAVVGYDA